MELKDLNEKSVADVRQIAGYLGVEILPKDSKKTIIEKITKFVTNDSSESQNPPAKVAKNEYVRVAKKAPADGKSKIVKSEKCVVRPENRSNQVAIVSEVVPTYEAEKTQAEKPVKKGRKSTKKEAVADTVETAEVVAAQNSEVTEAKPTETTIEDKTSNAGKEPEKNKTNAKQGKTRQKTANNKQNKANPENLSAESQKENQKIENKALENKPEIQNAETTNEIAKNAQSEPEQEPENNRYETAGVLEIMKDAGHGFLRPNGFYMSSDDIFVAPPLIKRFGLKTGDWVSCIAGKKAQKEKQDRDFVAEILSVNGRAPETIRGRQSFEKLTPIYPDERYTLEQNSGSIAARIIDLLSPIGKGQRGLIVSPPKAGKTVLLKNIADSIAKNYPQTKLIVLLIDERPEEVTDISESVNGLVLASTFDEMPERHIKVAELCLQYAERLVELGEDVVILMDSVTRLARAYNMTITPTGRSLSGGLDPGALYGPKKFFGAARNIRNGGSLTIVATALVDTGSKLDDVIYEEFKGTGNMELHLDRNLSEKRIFPSIDVKRSGTRREDLLLSENELYLGYFLRFAFSKREPDEVMNKLIDIMKTNGTNEKLFSAYADRIWQMKRESGNEKV